jgi:hypothetical protein
MWHEAKINIMRNKVYYTIDEIINNLYTPGGEWMYENGTEYIGEYHRYTSGEVYTRKNWNPTLSKKLVKLKDLNISSNFYRKEKENIQTTFKSIIPYNPIVSKTDIDNGFITRYFIQNVTNSIITEISPEQFKEYKQNLLDNNVYTTIELTWIIVGNLTTQNVNGAVITGIAETNKKTVSFYNKQMPGLNSKLANLTEFYTDTTYIVPENINPQ